MKHIKATVKVETRGNGVNGKIVVKSYRFHKVIPAVLFSTQEAKRLLEIIDKVDASYYTAVYTAKR